MFQANSWVASRRERSILAFHWSVLGHENVIPREIKVIMSKMNPFISKVEQEIILFSS